jgi:murein DD-endopeptidase MepM/ murein hydrolase activator NlpD
MRCAALPVDGRVTSPQGWRNRPSGEDLHTGVDIGAPEGSPVFAMFSGRVVVAAPSGELAGYGNVVVLEHGDYSLYAHLSRLDVAQGELVQAGQQIGTVGRTAGTRENPAAVFSSSGAHLHLEFLDRWPPRGRDLDRLDVGKVLAAAGVMVPAQGPLQAVCGTVPQILSTPQGRPVRASSSSGGAVGLLLVLLVLGQHFYNLKS